MIARDAATEAVRELALPTVAAIAFGLLALPLLAEAGVAVRDRALLDSGLALGWLLALLSGLRLGTLLDGQGLGVLLRPLVGDRRFLAERLLAHVAVLLCQSLTFIGAMAAHSAVRRAGPGLVLHALGCAGEATLALLLTALVVCVARRWLAALAAGALLVVGHLEQELLAALGDAALPGRILLLFVPSVERLDVQSALIRGAAPDPTTWAVGAAELGGWWAVVGLLLAWAWGHTDRR